MRNSLSFLAAALAVLTGCSEADGLMRAQPADVTVKFDFDHRPLPEIPLPNDIATRHDPTSKTGKRINASMIAPTAYERRTRTLIDQLDGWGLYQPITIPFTGEIDVNSVIGRHDEVDYDTDNDAIYLINIDRDSDQFGELVHLDVGNGNYPIILEAGDKYGDNDPRGWSLSLIYDEAFEDLNGNGKLDPSEDLNGNGQLDPGEDRNNDGILQGPEDTDADGHLDVPNYLPGQFPARDDLPGRADALMSMYERETNTLIASPLLPLQEQTTYAVVVTRRILDTDGNPIGSPFAYINHTAQTDDLEPLFEVLPKGLAAEDIAFAWPYTTESITDDWVRVREGLYEMGPQAHLGEEFPAEIERFFPLKDVGPGTKYEGRTPYLLFHDDWKDLLSIVAQGFFAGADTNSQMYDSIIGGHDYVDFHAMGTYISPQLFDRFDANGDRLPLDLQSWPNDLDLAPAEARPEEIPFWVVVPRKEVSVRAEGKQAPLVLLGHGYTSNRATELVGFAGFLSSFGFATISADNVSHGVPIDNATDDMFRPILGAEDLEPALEALKYARAEDLDNDGAVDSGVDFWTAYLFHTRDMVRQSALDYMQLIRIIKSWDGVKTWPYDNNQDGKDDLAGDFDGDGVLDVGSESPIFVMGASLGGIMATTLGGIEPEVEGIIPIAGGGRMSDIGNRSKQGGVPQAVLMRVMGPLFNATLMDDGTTQLYTEVVEYNRMPKIPLGVLNPAIDQSQGVKVWDTLVGLNLDNGEVDCAYILPDDVADDGVAGRARLAIPADLDDRVELRLYHGSVLETGSDECEVIEDVEPFQVINRFESPVDAEGNPMLFEGLPVEGGDLRALAEGFGLKRTTPSLRRFMGLAQLVLDGCDPGVHARYLSDQPFMYPNKGDVTGSRFLIVTTNGDMNVPAGSGVTVGRAAGVVDYRTIDPRYGKPANQVLIDTHTVEAVNTLGRHPYPLAPEDDTDAIRSLLHLDGSLGSHIDIENFAEGTDLWGDDVVRLDPPLRLMMDEDMWGQPLPGTSGAIFPFAIPEGQHGFALPGEMTDWTIQLCKERNGSNAPECNPDNIVGNTFDIGWAMFHAFGAWFKGRDNPFDPMCNSRRACNAVPPRPEVRDWATLP